MRNLLFAIVLVAALGSVESAAAEVYPSRPITMIVPFPAGGGTDVSARIVSEHMSRTLGQQIVIENIAGAGGSTGSTRAMRANPDGYTIEMGQMGTHATAVALYPNLAYKPDIDFAPIGLVNLNPVMIVARKDFPPRDFKEFVPYVKANAEKLNIQSDSPAVCCSTQSSALSQPWYPSVAAPRRSTLSSAAKSTTCATGG
jgi:tripartite-type tricarboxylate transporter receptor subunit TctC